jgi:HNH endonuclease
MGDITCSVKGCDKPAKTRGWCQTHYVRWWQTGDVGADIPVQLHLPAYAAGATCAVGGCDRRPETRGWCASHYERWRLTGDVRADVPLMYHSPPRTPDSRCAAEGCERPPRRGDWCGLHYGRWRKYGDPLVRVNVDIRGDPARVPVYVDQSGGPDACHPWTGGRNADGYGQAIIDGKVRLVHIVMWELENGPRPPGAELDHECHNQALRDGLCTPGMCAHRLCANLNHLVLRASKAEHHAATPGKELRRRGMNRKLTDAEVRELRTLLAGATGVREMGEIGQRYGISVTHAYRIKSGTAWNWLPD